MKKKISVVVLMFLFLIIAIITMVTTVSELDAIGSKDHDLFDREGDRHVIYDTEGERIGCKKPGTAC